MGFAWPLVLVSLLTAPLLIAGYLLALHRRRRLAISYSSVALIRVAAPGHSRWRRHVPFALLVAALATLCLAAARPQAKVDVPISQSAVILALDVSGSMCATDVDPNRLTAAQTAVRDFIGKQDDRTRIGLVVFSGFAQLAVAPTTKREDLLQAVDSLTTGRGTTIGAAILKSVDAISQIDPDVAPSGTDGAVASGTGQAAPDGATPAPSSPAASGRGAAAQYAPEIVVLLTDGANTRGIAPLDAARIAAARGVRVYPIGFGTTNPTSLVCTAAQLGGNGFDNFRQGPTGGGAFTGTNGRNFLVADEPTLREVAAITGGTFFSASKAGELQDVLSNLPRHVQVQQRDVELSVGLAGLGALLVLGAIAAAVRWSPFPA